MAERRRDRASGIGRGHAAATRPATPRITDGARKVVLDPARRLYDTFVKQPFLEHYRQ